MRLLAEARLSQPQVDAASPPTLAVHLGPQTPHLCSPQPIWGDMGPKHAPLKAEEFPDNTPVTQVGAGGQDPPPAPCRQRACPLR